MKNPNSTSILRWVAVLPVAFVGSIIGNLLSLLMLWGITLIPVFLIKKFTGDGFDKIYYSVANAAPYIFIPYYFIIIGVIIAPARKASVCTLLGILMVIILSTTTYLEVLLETPYSSLTPPWQISLGIIGTFISMYYARKSIIKE